MKQPNENNSNRIEMHQKNKLKKERKHKKNIWAKIENQMFYSPPRCEIAHLYSYGHFNLLLTLLFLLVKAFVLNVHTFA